MSWVISSVTDIRTYVCNENPGGVYGDEGSTEALVEAIRSADHPSYGTDWSEWLTVNIDALVDDALAAVQRGYCTVSDAMNRDF